MTSDMDSSIINNTSIQQNDQRRQIIHQLALLLHAHKCLQRERQITTNGDNHETTSQHLCTVPHCGAMRTVLQHMTKCADFKNCTCKYFASNLKYQLEYTDQSGFLIMSSTV
jgi:hypothetical protein